MTGSSRRGRALLLAVALCVAAGARADTQTLSCSESPSAGTAWACENFGTVAAAANVTFLLAVQPSDAQYSRFDVNITLTSLSGDADLCGPLQAALHPPQVAAHAGLDWEAQEESSRGSCTPLLIAALGIAALQIAGSENHILDLRKHRARVHRRTRGALAAGRPGASLHKHRSVVGCCLRQRAPAGNCARSAAQGRAGRGMRRKQRRCALSRIKA